MLLFQNDQIYFNIDIFCTNALKKKIIASIIAHVFLHSSSVHFK